MAADGRDEPRSTSRVRGLLRSLTLRRAIAIAAAIVLLALVGRLVAVDDPLGGEPVAIISLDRMPSAQSSTGEALGMRSTVDSAEADPLPQGQALAPADIVIADPLAAEAPATPGAQVAGAEPGLVEMSRHGPLPVIAPDGRRASEAYSRSGAAPAPNVPRVAVLIGGMGLSVVTSETAIDRLPAEVSLAFAPYGGDIERLTGRARQAGHEVLLHMPMEPYDYPDNDPGPHTLLTGLDRAQNRDRLHWVMSRFTGYVGVVNYMGARFTASDEALRPFLGELRDRGLFFVDDGSSPRSLADGVAQDIGLAFAGADIVVDSVPSRAAIDEALAKLEARALEAGSALGVASSLPVSIDAIRDWAKGLEARGVALVPVSSLVGAGAT